MKTKLFLIGLLIWNFSSVFGQICGTPHPENPTVYPQRNLNAQLRTLNQISSTPLCVYIFFHIVRNTNGTNAFALPDTNDIVRELNEFYSPHHIIINNAGSEFIDNSNYPITPDPISSSSRYQAANCPAAMADCGLSKTKYKPLAVGCRVAFANGWR